MNSGVLNLQFFFVVSSLGGIPVDSVHSTLVKTLEMFRTKKPTKPIERSHIKFFFVNYGHKSVEAIRSKYQKYFM